MSRVCQITGKRPMTGNTVSHANNRRRRRFLPNLHVQRFWLESERRFVSLRVSTRGLRTIEKKGIEKSWSRAARPGRRALSRSRRIAMREKIKLAVVGRHRPLLHHDQEQAAPSGQDGGQEIRPEGPQARGLQGNEDQVSRTR